MNVTFSDRARDDLDQIGMRIAQENPERAQTFVEELIDAGMALADFPDRFPVFADLPQMKLRKRVYGNYLIFYRIHEGAVAVARVVHASRDYLTDLLSDG